MTVEAPVRSSSSQQEKDDDKEKDIDALIEEYTAAYLHRRISLETYRQQISRLNSRLDLRRAATRLGG